jgi:hypothetical protein
VPLRAVVCASDAFDALDVADRLLAIDVLRRATPVGGVHLLRGRPNAPATVTFDEWRTWYDGWAVDAEPSGGGTVPCATYVARRLAEVDAGS